ncbi:folate family ECF transporter S component [Haploplasma axanthum]|uniref:Predicted membrane protein n=1 Tax=Haploplasma axanthum TaxID=29552 RepID=A0A449BCS4_HAPAX|nr:folate family ECF transporter S component [Haploplasma axanthum]VEU80249.1 Predicted membrane protein [Haploplasma axanthum]
MELKKIVLASILTALSIVIDITFNALVPTQTMGTAYYAIPIIIAGIFLGVKYSLLMAFIGDSLSVIIGGIPFFPLFSIGAMMWGLLPGLLLKNKKGFSRILVVVLITHILVTTLNSVALMVHYHKSITGLLIDLPLRAFLIIPNSIIIALLVEAVLTPIELRKNVEV